MMENNKTTEQFGGRPGASIDPAAGKRRIFIAGISLALLFAGYGGFWLYTADRAMDYLENWAVSSGGNISWRSMSSKGFPFHLSVSLVEPGATGSQGGKWSTDLVVLDGRPWNWTEFSIHAPNTHKIVSKDGLKNRTILIDTDRLEGTFSILPDKGISSTITAINARLQDNQVQKLSVDGIKIEIETSPEVPPDHEHRAGLLWFSVTGIQSAEIAQLSLGERINKASGEIKIYGPLPLPLTSRQLSRWRDAGGVMEVRSLRLEYGPLNLHTEGTLALDGELQPVGAFTARIHGFHATIDALHQAGVLGSGEALTAKLVLGAMAQTDSMTGQSSLNLPISIQDRTIYAGPIKLGKVPPVHWKD